MKRRVFVAIPIPRTIQEEIEVWQIQHPDFRMRWIKPQNLHITVIPPWYIEEGELYRVENALQQAIGKFQPFSVHFQRVLWGPPGPEARLIWAEANCLASAGNLAERPREASKFPRVSPRGRNEGDTPEEFKNLKSSTEETLMANPETEFSKSDNRPAQLHLTVARFEPKPIKKLSQLDETVNWSFEVNKIQLMESVLKREGAEYAALREFSIIRNS